MNLTLDLSPAVRDQVFIERQMERGGVLVAIQAGTWLYRFRLPLTLLMKML